MPTAVTAGVTTKAAAVATVDSARAANLRIS
jgi:hypothetical protein